MKHLKRFYTQDDANDFLDNFDGSQSPGVIIACDEHPGTAMILSRPGAELNLVFEDYTGAEMFTRQIPYDPEMILDDADADARDLIPEEYSNYTWDLYHNGVKLQLPYDADETLSNLGINPGDTLVYKEVTVK